MTGITFSRAAREDRQLITAFTVERFGIEQARELRRRFEVALSGIAQFPGSGQLRPELDPPGRAFRYTVVSRRFIVVYDPDSAGIRVVRILHGARQLAREIRRDHGDDE